ncbi:MAG TPA: GIY-YIG nuclease family protein [Candidatus Binatia bacterium]|jgi:predicted GIY-YIG superfamily endonuclease|nr:GIY-YIG nuclease family protein [Candidatus Binatia bacterium]
MQRSHWYVYVVRCSDGSLYTGTAPDVDRELSALNGGEGSTYVRARLPVFLAYTEEYMNERDASRRAASVKRLSRVSKESLLALPCIGAVGELGLAT